MRRTWTVVLAGVLLTAPLAWGAPKPGPAEDKRPVAELLKAMDTDVAFERDAAARALGARGKAVLPKLLAALKARSRHLRRGATTALAQMGTDAASAAGPLVKALTDKEPWVRAGAAAALVKTGKLADEHVKALAAAAGDPDPWVREVVMSVIKGATNDKAVLLKAACDAISIPHSSWGICRHSMGIITAHGASNKALVVPTLLKLLSDPPEGMWDGGPGAVTLLVKMGEVEKTVAVLTKVVVSDSDNETARRAADRLAQIGPDAKAALPVLRKRAKTEKRDRTQVSLARAIAILEGKDDPNKKK